MAKITDIYLFAETRAGVNSANSGSRLMELEINSQGQIVKRSLGDAPGDNFEPTRCDIWHFDMGDEVIDDTLVSLVSFDSRIHTMTLGFQRLSGS